jgi:hypothetical protein
MSVATSALVTLGLVAASIAGTAAVASADPLVLEAKITGSTSLGGQLTADHGDFAGTDFTYEWRNVTENPKTVIGRDSTFSPDSGDRADQITVTILAKAAPVTDTTTGVTAAPVAVSDVSDPIVVTGGSLAVSQSTVIPGETFPVTGSFFAPSTTYLITSGPTFSQNVTSGADGTFSLVVPVAAKDAAGSNTVTAVHAAAGRIATVTITITQPPKPPVIVGSSPTVAGTVKVGNTVRARVGTWKGNASFDYQWLLSGKEIAGATNSTYDVTAGGVGKNLRVKIVGSVDAASLTVTSAPYKVAAATFSSTASVKLKGVAKVGRTLKAVKSGSYRPSDVVTTYQWYVGSTKIAGATKTTLKVKKSWKNKYLSVRMTTTKDGYATSTRTAYSAKIKAKKKS